MLSTAHRPARARASHGTSGTPNQCTTRTACQGATNQSTNSSAYKATDFTAANRSSTVAVLPEVAGVSYPVSAVLFAAGALGREDSRPFVADTESFFREAYAG
jgi:hypothetical protein